MRPMPSRAILRMLFRLNTEPLERIVARWTSTTALNGASGTGVRKMFACAEVRRTVAGMLRRRNPEKAARENCIRALHRADCPIWCSGEAASQQHFLPADFGAGLEFATA